MGLPLQPLASPPSSLARSSSPLGGSASKTAPANADEQNHEYKKSLFNAARLAGAAIQGDEDSFAETLLALNGGFQSANTNAVEESGSPTVQPPPAESPVAAPPAADESELAVNLIAQKFQTLANAAVLRTSNDMLGTLLDVQA